MAGRRADPPVDAAFALQILHSCCHVLCHPDQRLGRQAVALVAKEGEEVATWWRAEMSAHTHTHTPRTHTGVKGVAGGPGGRRRTLTLDELHDDVDGLPLGANTNQLHDVGMVVAL